MEFELLSAVANVGFPIAVAGYLLVRMESKMDALTAAISALTTRLSDGKKD
jgi:hypothetical protein